MMSQLPFMSVFLIALLTACNSGCGRRNPVNEIKVADSGIEIVDRPVESDSLGWPLWRGPNGDGVAANQPLLTEWSESSGILWRADVPGRGHSSPTVVGDSVYLATALVEQQKQQIVAYNRQTGEMRWTAILHDGGFPSERRIHKKSTHANGTVACDGERLYTAFLNSDSIIAAAVSLNGDLVWQKEIGSFVSKFGYAPSPILYKSLVIFAADNSGGGYLAAVDGATGKIAWRVARENVSSYSSPTVAKVGGRDLVLISGCGAVTSYDPASGNEVWKTPCVAEATCGTIVTTSDLIFASGGYPEKETVCLSADGRKVWSNRTGVYEPSLVVADDQVIAVSDDGIASCWAVRTGDTIWRERLAGNFSASPIVCGSRVYASNLSGETFVFTSNNGQYELVARNKLGSDCYASPAVADGQLFLRIGVGSGSDRREQLVCIGDTVDISNAE
ncbi:MAG: PQQ-binding-like beta-propeller repeat protein [Planctomycetaceae bacterium]